MEKSNFITTSSWIFDNQFDAGSIINAAVLARKEFAVGGGRFAVNWKLKRSTAICFERGFEECAATAA